jgi:hypothetical protein
VKYESGRGRRVAFGELRKRCEDIVNIGRREIFCEAGRNTELLLDCPMMAVANASIAPPDSLTRDLVTCN